MKFRLTRTVTRKECPWLDRTFRKGTIVFRFYGCTYGSIGPEGIAVTEDPEGKLPFTELPNDALEKY
jgi:hypothetical protein